MGRFSDEDPEYLRQCQYADSSNLSDRMNLHQRFSVNPIGWHRWVFDQLSLSGATNVLEAACGMGALWATNADRLSDGIELTLTDFSAGMVATTVDALGQVAGVRAAVADVQHVPFPDDSFDVVVCNHALYHVPDRARAAAELRRVLRPEGVACLATNGLGHLRQLVELRARHVRGWEPDDTARTFGLETAPTQLAGSFGSLDLRRYDDELRVTEVEPLMAFVLSTPIADQIDDSTRVAMAAEVRDTIATHGAFVIAKDSGLFLCR